MAPRIIGSFAATVKEATGDDAVGIEFGPAKDVFYVDNPGWISFGQFAHASESGLDNSTVEGQAAMYDFLRAAIAAPPESEYNGAEGDSNAPSNRPTKAAEFSRFREIAVQYRVEADELMKIVSAVIAEYNARPTRPASASTGGPPTTSISSNGQSSLGSAPSTPASTPRELEAAGTGRAVDGQATTG